MCSSRILRRAWRVRTGLGCGSVEEVEEVDEAESSSIGGVMERLVFPRRGGGCGGEEEVLSLRGGGGGDRECDDNRPSPNPSPTPNLDAEEVEDKLLSGEICGDFVLVVVVVALLLLPLLVADDDLDDPLPRPLYVDPVDDRLESMEERRE